MNVKKTISVSSIAAGGLIALAGAAFVLMYVFEAVIFRLGEPDQSLLFWYLPIFFIGIFGVMAGVRLVLFGWKRLRGAVR